MIHSQRLEYPLLQEIAVKHAGDAVDDEAQQYVPRIAVRHIRARLEVQWLGGCQLNQLQVSVVVNQIQQLPLGRRKLGNARLVVEHGSQSHLTPARRNFRQVFGQWIVQIEFVLVGKHHYRDRRELLADAADLVHGVRLCSHTVFESGYTVTFDIERLSVPRYGERNPGIFCRRIWSRI